LLLLLILIFVDLDRSRRSFSDRLSLSSSSSFCCSPAFRSPTGVLVVAGGADIELLVLFALVVFSSDEFDVVVAWLIDRSEYLLAVVLFEVGGSGAMQKLVIRSLAPTIDCCCWRRRLV
jgi:hypothetical protein